MSLRVKETIMRKTIKFKLNGKPTALAVEEDSMLLWVLRGALGLTGPKFGCGEGYCGACTVVVDDKAVRSCQFPAANVDGKAVLTIEGLAADGKLHPLQEAFVRHDALQCGYCTSGMIMNAYALLLRNTKPTREEILDEMEGNLCRCGAHVRIVEAIQTAARNMAGGPKR
jgi:aerobic-type carbon monoxide dehydrogenase small subunit (CoxS/CutS family)